MLCGKTNRTSANKSGVFGDDRIVAVEHDNRINNLLLILDSHSDEMT